MHPPPTHPTPYLSIQSINQSSYLTQPPTPLSSPQVLGCEHTPELAAASHEILSPKAKIFTKDVRTLDLAVPPQVRWMYGGIYIYIYIYGGAGWAAACEMDGFRYICIYGGMDLAVPPQVRHTHLYIHIYTHTQPQSNTRTKPHFPQKDPQNNHFFLPSQHKTHPPT